MVEGTVKEFGLTGVPYVPLWDSLQTRPGRVSERLVRESSGEAVQTVQLTQQEFLLFRDVREDEQVMRLAERFGQLGIANAVRVPPDQQLRPFWFSALTRDPTSHAYDFGEPIEDWVIQSGLLSVALGLLGLLHVEGSSELLVHHLQRIRSWPRDLDRLDQRLDKQRDWPVICILDGSRRAAVRVQQRQKGTSHMLGLSRPPRAPNWSNSSRPRAWFQATTGGIEGCIRLLINPWLQRLRMTLSEQDGITVPGIAAPTDLLGILWIQFANTFLTRVKPRICAWERCPGPPDRPGLFMWQWGTGLRHGDSIYCDNRCRQAAAQAKHRRALAYRAQGRRK